MAVDVASMVEWISAIPFEEWPQQTPLEDGDLRPAMVNSTLWPFQPGHRWSLGFAMAKPVADIHANDSFWTDGPVAFENHMLSVVMPRASIPPHADHQQPGWITRVHVPLLTNPWAFFDVLEPERSRYQMEVGQAYLVDITRRHEVHNNGPSPRLHFMFDVMGAQPIPASER
jgi:hypothetical protein